MSSLHRSVPVFTLLLALAPALVSAQERESSYTISPNERIHVIQRKTDLVDGRLEVTFYPVTYQLNSRWTYHLGQGVGASYHLSETFGLQALFGFNDTPGLSIAEETDLMTELRDKARLQPDSANSVITSWYGMASFEIAPIYGKIAYYEEAMLRFGLFLTVGAGVVGTKLQLTPRAADETPQFATAGLRGGGLLGAGFRVHLPGRWMLRVEVRDLIYSARIDSLNGCNAEQLLIGDGGASGSLEGRCLSGFMDLAENQLTGTARTRVDNSTNTINNVSGYVGFSYLF